MEANYYQAITNPHLQGGWLNNFNQQDFCEGAKGLNSLHPVSPSSTLYNSSNYDEWMEVNEALGGNEFEPFNHVLLTETKDFGPDFFGGLDEHLLPENNSFGINELSISNDLYGSNNIYLNSLIESVAPSEKPKITTIKLKKVKIPKKKQSFKNEFQVCDYEVASSLSEAEGMTFFGREDDLVESSQAGSSLFASSPLQQDYSNEYDTSKSEIDKILSDDYMYLENYLQEIKEPINMDPSVLTLKEAIEKENADLILDAYLSPDRSNLSIGSPQDQSLNSSFQEENLFSPTNSSQCSYSEGVPSPSSSLDDGSFDAGLTTTDTQILFSNDSSMLSSSRNEEQTTRKGRKPRQKLTPESKYLRKKEQNKQAALRYRVKKKFEEEQLIQTLKDQEDRNAKLKRESKNLSQEFKFIKKLVKESLIARNLVPPNAFH